MSEPLWEEFAESALSRLRQAGVEYADIRLLDSRTRVISGADRRIAALRDDIDRGFGIRVLHRGAWGFAASSILSREEVPRVADLALDIAKASAQLTIEKVRLAPEPPHRAVIVTPCDIDPFDVPLDAQIDLLRHTMETIHSRPDIARSQANLWMQRDRKLLVTTEGTHLDFTLLAIQGDCQATAVSDGRFAARSFNTPHVRRGYEAMAAVDFLKEGARIAEEARDKVRAPVVEAGRYDLVLDPEHLSLTIHESCGHPSELDRALGYEANYAGTSFLTPNKRGTYRYGSSQVNLRADNTEPETLAATGYDDDGVSCQAWDIVREGMFVGYCTNRETAPKIQEPRSRGSNRADGWAGVPMVRIANIGLEPGAATIDELLADVKRGIYIEGHGSYSIDQRRYNFQFGGNAFWLIEQGKKTQMLRDVIYHGITPEFWGRCDGVADRASRRRYGFITCGKGQPGQAGWMTHAASPARFRRIDVIAGQAAVEP